MLYAFIMLRRLASLGLIALLLLPTSLVGAQGPETCASKGCGCCSPLEPGDLGDAPIVRKGCCCNFKAPDRTPASSPTPERDSAPISVDAPAMASIAIALPPSASTWQTDVSSHLISLRGPPGALHLLHCSFLC